ncbi:hypothetical protein LZ199_15950 [Myxococcus sp. QH3KD-4-1]|nr:hypothetical protein [Myxococcus qinghaiensis]
MERLSRAEDGRIANRMKRPLPDGTTHLLFTGLELLASPGVPGAWCLGETSRGPTASSLQAPDR